MLVDEINLTIKAGMGGNGARTFKALPDSPKTPSDGGNGGNGGNIYVQGSTNVSDLSQFRFQKSVKGEDGTNGGHNNLYGKRGKDITILLPIGTKITDTKSLEEWEILDDTPLLIAQGGRGGIGNHQYKPDIHRINYYTSDGRPGEERHVHLVLRFIAKIGFVGFPNAGKSSLLDVLTNATPKIGNYPFTTLEPNLGVISGQKSVVADIPGLIEGASEGKGLGIKFLKHIEKTELLVHLIDATAQNPVEIYETVRKEFASYDKSLTEKPEIIVLSKIDLLTDEELEKKVQEFKKLKKTVLPLSIYDDKSIEKLKKMLEKKLK